MQQQAHVLAHGILCHLFLVLGRHGRGFLQRPLPRPFAYFLPHSLVLLHVSLCINLLHPARIVSQVVFWLPCVVFLPCANQAIFAHGMFEYTPNPIVGQAGTFAPAP